MSRMIRIYLDDATEARLIASAKELNRKIEDLAERCVEEGALMAWRGRVNDPGKPEVPGRGGI